MSDTRRPLTLVMGGEPPASGREGLNYVTSSFGVSTRANNCRELVGPEGGDRSGAGVEASHSKPCVAILHRPCRFPHRDEGGDESSSL